MSQSLTDLFNQQNIRYIKSNNERIKKCLGKINADELWWRPNDSTNSIGNLILHLSGNIQQYICSGLTDKPDARDRDSEFVPDQGFSSDRLIDMLHKTITEACAVISQLSEENLKKEYVLQGFQMTGLEAVLHVTEHLSYHTGQIAWITKRIKDTDLGFYKGLDLNKKNS